MLFPGQKWRKNAAARGEQRAESCLAGGWIWHIVVSRGLVSQRT